jgi:hypothetical protein
MAQDVDASATQPLADGSGGDLSTGRQYARCRLTSLVRVSASKVRVEVVEYAEVTACEAVIAQLPPPTAQAAIREASVPPYSTQSFAHSHRQNSTASSPQGKWVNLEVTGVTNAEPVVMLLSREKDHGHGWTASGRKSGWPFLRLLSR